MNRYKITDNAIDTRFDGKRFFKTTVYPEIPLDPTDTYIVATSEDFLDTLADRFYRDSSLWWVISQANNIKGTLKPKVGSQLRIPGNINSILMRFSVANS